MKVAPPEIEAQLGCSNIPVLLDTGSERSLISCKHLEQITSLGVKPRLSRVQLNCVTASGQSLEIIGEIKLCLKIQGFSWRWKFLVSRKLQGSSILGRDFIAKTKMVIDIGNSCLYFAFAPET